MFQILDCTDIGTCCSDYALANMLDIARRIVELIQLIAPILLILMAMVQLIQLTINPDTKDGIKKILNKVYAAVTIFSIPVIFNISIGILPDDFSVVSCWNQAKVMREISKETKNTYISLNDKKASSILINSSDYEGSNPAEKSSKSSSKGGSGGQKLVNTAINEIGNHESDHSHHKYEAYTGLSDDQPWCAAFVTWCVHEAGISHKIIPKYTYCPTGYTDLIKAGGVEHKEGSGYNPVAGDIIFYGTASVKTHTGIVITSDDTHVYTIEGNTSCEGDAVSKCKKSDGVSKKTRRRPGNIYGYITPKY